ncbi:Holliday junction resolvase RecU [Xylocopilactobacillus apicola]|uniref:Holliday junction resolvase RecU n=1 Tax=Xylocopilactobacillus apicola TaxID=2932184 RepID=A0AAU9D7U3_9LACO|nr:Holliday junction resolvase RecU [Xylocopilactobacillus apicola]BDR58385.1 Holliday junction resolvase RecU [Xylocopilactobacillus apicola]
MAMIKYPTGQGSKKNLKEESSTNFGRRGMSLEKMINLSNKHYLNLGIAVVHKKPTPIQIVKVDYPNRSHARITEAFFRQPSTTDYNGVYKGYYLDFEAKETTRATYLPLDNFHEHQIHHMEQCLKQKGICFVIVSFVKLNRFFMLNASQVIKYWNLQTKNGRKSIPVEIFETHGYEFKPSSLPLIPYIDYVDAIIAKESK